MIFNGYLAIAGLIGFVRFSLYLLPRSTSLPYQLSLKRAEKKYFDHKFTRQHLFCIASAIAFTAVHLYSKHWLLSNLFGLILSFNAITLLRLDSFRTGITLLAGLCIYDLIMVFKTPMMVSVARDFEAPVKIVWPRETGTHKGFAMLGLGGSFPRAIKTILTSAKGDIVLPGLFLSLARRFDYHLALKKSDKPLLPSSRWPKPYYSTQVAAYLLALCTTIVVMHHYQHAQPALLYISPACIGGVLLTAAVRGELRYLLGWTEDDKDDSTSEDRQKAG